MIGATEGRGAEDARKRADKAIAQACHVLISKGLKICEGPGTLVGDAGAILLDEARAWGADLIVLRSHDRHGFDRLILGSVSESIALCRLLARDHPQVSYFATKSRGFPLPTSFPSVNHMIEKGQTKQPLMPVLPQRETLVFPVTAWRRRFNVHSKHRPLGL